MLDSKLDLQTDWIRVTCNLSNAPFPAYKIKILQNILSCK